MDTDLEILKNLAGYVKFAAMRTSNNQLVFVNEHALELFGYASGEEMRMMGRRMLFADGEAYYDLMAKQKA